jgi:hypothetical protein
LLFTNGIFQVSGYYKGVIGLKIALVACPDAVSADPSSPHDELDRICSKVHDLSLSTALLDVKGWWASTEASAVVTMGMLAYHGGIPGGLDTRLSEYPARPGETAQDALSRITESLVEIVSWGAACNLDSVAVVSHPRLLVCHSVVHYPGISEDRLLRQIGRPDVAVLDWQAGIVTFDTFWSCYQFEH